MDGKTALELLNSGRCLRIRCWPDNFFLYKENDEFKYSNNSYLSDSSIFEVNDWEEYDPSLLFFSARCESDRLNKIKHFSLDDDIIDL